jgi:S1-C subfamily serine protease
MKQLLVGLVLLGVVLVPAIGNDPPTHPPLPLAVTSDKTVLQNLLAASVMVVLPEGTGSGVAFKNREHTFVWTDAHVIDTALKQERVHDPVTGRERQRVRFADVKLSQGVIEKGRKVGENVRFAEVLRYDADQDIALLRVRASGWPAAGVSFCKDVPEPGEKIWHVGSAQGSRGQNGLADGTFSAAGRLRFDFTHNEEDGLVYDEVTVTGHPGCSGGGVFRRSGECLGLVTEMLGRGTHGTLCMTPARRLREFAEANACLWALDQGVAVVEKDLRLITGEILAPRPAPAPVLIPVKP